MRKTYIIDTAIKLFGYYLFNKHQSLRILEMEQQLREANSLLRDIAYLTDEDKVGQTIEHKESVIESTHHYTSAYCERHGLKYEEV